MSRSLFYVWVVGLFLIGLIVALMRHLDTGIPFFPGQKDTVWMVEARVDFQAFEDEPVTVSLNLPDRIPGYRLFMEQTASAGYGFSIVNDAGERRGEWTRREAEGSQTLYYKIQVVSDPDARRPGESKPASSSSQSAPPMLWDDIEQVAAEQLLRKARQTSSGPLSMARELIKLTLSPENSQNVALLRSNYTQTQLLKRLLTQADIPVRVSKGLKLEDKRRNQSLISMLEVHVNETWHVLDPETGEQGWPESFLLWQNAGALIEVIGGENAKVSFSMLKQNMPALDLAKAQTLDSGFGLFSVYQLPIEEQGVFKLLLLLPIGALVTVFLRIGVGVRTSGTFMPVLIAMAFMQTSLLPGLVNFISIVAFGLLLRSYLSALNLLLVARIATIIVIVIFLVGLMSLLGYQLGFNTGMTVAFFPIIILAWTIERMSILWEEEGAKEVMVQGFGSLLVAILAYFAMKSATFGHLTFNFPELNLIVVALIMLMGRYTGYRLLELRRFHVLKGT
ncbi:MAG: inactive transglutaminase family protein [Hydrogenovibrio sp.]|uniref:inactive transglutaminase family protein n=1 Tax=Hydrogenovibrio sp. TaxID=2065821 RepID=UPI0028709E72|nr:inactive transglutaminase family protein [Hydrogenovibrio sp.]MDR9499398.1 inactive transglutaminase family protein [Hydrogenovibrio sp.]